MDLDGGLIFRITQGKDELEKAKKMGIKEEMLIGSGKVAWKFVNEYAQTHGAVPGLHVVQDLCGTAFREVDAKLDWIATEVLRRDLFNALKMGVVDVEKSLEHVDPQKALEQIEKLAELGRSKRVNSVKVTSLTDLGQDVIEMYKKTKKGEIGVPFPWPSMNDMTMGLWPGTLTFFAARPGVGKTFTIVLISLYAWSREYRVLLVSPEMSGVEIAERAFSISTRTSYRDVVSGALGEFAEKRFFDGVMEQKGIDGLYIMDGAEFMEPGAIEDAIDVVKPDLVGVDSAYMIRSAPGNRYDRMLATVDWLREMPKKKQVPAVALSQFRKLDSKKAAGSMDDMAMTDTVAWDAHNIFGLTQDDDMKADKVMEFSPIKIRRQAFQTKVRVNWDFELMNFEEIGAESEEFTDKGFEEDDVPF